MRKPTDRQREALLRLKGSPDFADTMTWLDEGARELTRLAIHPEPMDEPRHVAGQAYGTEQITARIREIWEAREREQ